MFQQSFRPKSRMFQVSEIVGLSIAQLCRAGLLLCCLVGLNQSVLGETSTNFQPMDVFDLEYASYPQVSHDGEQVIYMRRSFNVMRDATRSALWMVDLGTGNHEPLFADFGSYGWPTWSHSGEQIAYVTASGRRHQIRILHLASGRTALLADLADAPRWLAFSPDDRQIAFTQSIPQKVDAPLYKAPKKPKGAKWSAAAKVVDTVRYQFDGRGIVAPSFSQVFVLPSDGGTPRQLTQGNYQHVGPLAWRGGNDSLLFSANRREGWALETFEGDLYEVELSSLALRQVTTQPGREYAPKIARDGNRILYLSESSERATYRHARLMLLDEQKQETQPLGNDLDVSIQAAVWSDRDRSVSILYDRQAKRHLAELSLKGKLSVLSEDVGGTSLGRPYLSGGFDYRSGTYGLTLAKKNRPADLGVIRDRELTQVTHLNEDLLATKTLAQVQSVRYPSSFDGTLIHGFYLTPPDFDPSKRYPLILELHGGPHLAYGDFFSAEMQLMASEGYIVFYDNYRGSASYGEDFALLLQGKYASREDFQDHMSGIDHLIDRGFVDADNLFICGGSAGGIGTAYAIGLTDRFNAAVAAKPVINWISKTLTADSYVFQTHHQFSGPPWEKFDEYWQRSPLSLMGNVVTPTMLLTGEKDRRTPISETEQFYQALKLKGVDAVMVRLPGSAHSIAGRPSRLLSKVGHTLAWFERYRKPSQPQQTSPVSSAPD